MCKLIGFHLSKQLRWNRLGKSSRRTIRICLKPSRRMRWYTIEFRSLVKQIFDLVLLLLFIKLPSRLLHHLLCLIALDSPKDLIVAKYLWLAPSIINEKYLYDGLSKINKIYQTFITYAKRNEEISQKGLSTFDYTSKQCLQRTSQSNKFNDRRNNHMCWTQESIRNLIVWCKLIQIQTICPSLKRVMIKTFRSILWT